MATKPSEGEAASVRALIALSGQLAEALEDDDRLEAPDVLARVKAMHRLRVTVGRVDERSSTALEDAITRAAELVAIRTAEAVERQDRNEIDVLTRAGATLRWCRNGPARDKTPR